MLSDPVGKMYIELKFYHISSYIRVHLYSSFLLAYLDKIAKMSPSCTHTQMEAPKTPGHSYKSWPWHSVWEIDK